MWKKSIGLLLALLIAVGTCACAVQQPTPAEQAADSVSTTLAPEEDDTRTEQESAATKAKKRGQKTAKQKAGTTLEQNGGKQASSSAKQSDTQKEDAAKKNAFGAKNTAGKKGNTSNKSAKQPSSAGQTTTKQQTTTQKQTTTKKTSIRVSLSINCSQAVGKADGVPASGYFLSGLGVNMPIGANVYEALCQGCAAAGVSVTATRTGYGMYVSAIGGLAEKEVGAGSGWTYTVNGVYPPKAVDKYTLSDGDTIQFIYKVA